MLWATQPKKAIDGIPRQPVWSSCLAVRNQRPSSWLLRNRRWLSWLRTEDGCLGCGSIAQLATAATKATVFESATKTTVLFSQPTNQLQIRITTLDGWSVDQEVKN